jgi:hypothetical protein
VCSHVRHSDVFDLVTRFVVDVDNVVNVYLKMPDSSFQRMSRVFDAVRANVSS